MLQITIQCEPHELQSHLDALRAKTSTAPLFDKDAKDAAAAFAIAKQKLTAEDESQEAEAIEAGKKLDAYHAAEIAAGYEIDNLFAIKAQRVRLARKLSGEAVRLLSRRGRSGGEIHSDKASHKPTVTPCWKRDVLRQLCRTIELSAFLKDGSAAGVKILLRPTACAKSDSRAAMISRIRCRLPAGWRPGSTRRQRRS